MNFQQAQVALKALVQSMPALFSSSEMRYHFFGNSPSIGDWSKKQNMGMLVTGDGVGCKSGIYLFGSPDETIIYIGKATKDNLHHRVWDHCKTPEITPDSQRTFPKHSFDDSGLISEADYIRSGQARLGVVTVSDPELVSLIEVFLHTIHIKTHRALPVLNKQIG